MAEDTSADEKTEQATQQRRDDFRREGQVAQSREIGGILILFSLTILFYFFSRSVIHELYELFSNIFADQVIVAARSGDFVPAVKLAGQK